jgi:hypothetical protein
MLVRYRQFTHEEIEYSLYDLQRIIMELDPIKGVSVDWTNVYVSWKMDTDGNRIVSIGFGFGESMDIPVECTQLLNNMEHFRKAFGNDKTPEKEIYMKLAHYDVHRTLKYPLIAYYQKKIAELNRF